MLEMVLYGSAYFFRYSHSAATLFPSAARSSMHQNQRHTQFPLKQLLLFTKNMSIDSSLHLYKMVYTSISPSVGLSVVGSDGVTLTVDDASTTIAISSSFDGM